MKLSPAQARMLSYLLECCDPAKQHWVDVDGHDGQGRNPTFRKLRSLGLIEYSRESGNSWRAALTMRGIHWLHGER